MRPDKYAPLLIGFLLAIAVLLAYCDLPSQQFVYYDDSVHIYQNPLMASPGLGEVAHFWNSPFRAPDASPIKGHFMPYDQLYAPLTFTLFALLAHVNRLPAPVMQTTGTASDLNPAVYHSANLIFHVLNVLLVFGLLRFLLKRKAGRECVWAAGAGALLFGLHPLQVQTVAWVSALNNVLSAFFCLLALWQYLAAIETMETKNQEHDREHGTAAPKRKAAALYGSALICFVLALLSKPSAAALPVVAFILEIGFWNRAPRAALRGLWPWLVFSFVIYLVARSMTSGVPPSSSLWLRPILVADALAFYFAKVVWPFGLKVSYNLYPQAILDSLWGHWAWLWPLLLGGVIAWACRRWPRATQPWLPAGALIFALCLLPVSGLVPYYAHIYSVVADRYMYFSLLGPSLVLAGALAAWPVASKGAARSISAGALGIAFCALGFLTALQTLIWHDSVTLATHMAANDTRDGQAHLVLAFNAARQNRFDEALFHNMQVIQSSADDANIVTAHNSAALIYLQLNRPEEAIAHFRRALQMDSSMASVAANLGIALAQQGRYQEAVAPLRHALRLEPGKAAWRRHLQLCLNRLGESGKAGQPQHEDGKSN